VCRRREESAEEAETKAVRRKESESLTLRHPDRVPEMLGAGGAGDVRGEEGWLFNMMSLSAKRPDQIGAGVARESSSAPAPGCFAQRVRNRMIAEEL